MTGPAVPRELRLVFKFRAEANAFRAYMVAFFSAGGGEAALTDPFRLHLSGLRAGEALAVALEAAKFGGAIELTDADNEPRREEARRG